MRKGGGELAHERFVVLKPLLSQRIEHSMGQLMPKGLSYLVLRLPCGVVHPGKRRQRNRVFLVIGNPHSVVGQFVGQVDPPRLSANPQFHYFASPYRFPMPMDASSGSPGM